MAIFKIVVSEPKTRKSYQLEVDQSKAAGLIGKKIDDEFNGDFIGLTGYGLQITGGTDKDGFPMHPSIKGLGRKRVLLSGPPGFYPRLKGQRKRKTVRGNTISEDITQINVKVVKAGEKSLEEIVPKKEKPKKPEETVEKKEEKPKPKEEKKEEKPKEEKKAEEKPNKPEVKPEEKKPEKKEEKHEPEKKSGGEKGP